MSESPGDAVENVREDATAEEVTKKSEGEKRETKDQKESTATEEESSGATENTATVGGAKESESESAGEKEGETEGEKEKEKEGEKAEEEESNAGGAKEREGDSDNGESEGEGKESKEEAKEEEREESDAKKEQKEEEEGIPFVDVTKPNAGRIPLSSVRLEEFYTTPDRTALAGAVEGLNHFPLKSSGTVPLALSFAPPPGMSPANVPMPVGPYATGVFANTAPDDPPGPQQYIGDAAGPNKGYRLFSDVFSRADKNDDGGLTFEEFRAYFDDGHVTDAELLALFNDVDLDNNGNISLRELDCYFRRGFEPYSRMFSVLAKMHSAISGGMGHSYREYPRQAPLEQFKTRFYLREFVSQIQALHSPVASALEILEHATEVRRSTGDLSASAEGPTAAHSPTDSSDTERIAPRKARDARASAAALSHSSAAVLSHATDGGADVLARLQAEVGRLAAVVEEVHSSRARLRWVQHDVFAEHAPAESSFVVACRTADVTAQLVYLFRDAARAYIAATQAEEGCLHVYIKQHANETKYAIYEIFASEDALCEHNTSRHFRHFQKEIIDCLEEPLASNLMEMPASWWGVA